MNHYIIYHTIYYIEQQEPKYAQLNWIISLVMSSCIAGSLQFSGQLKGDSREMGYYLRKDI